MNDTQLNTCQWIGENFRPSCTCKVIPGKSYCKDHVWLVYKEGTAQRKRKKDILMVDKVRLVEELMNEAIAELEAEGFDVYGTRELDLFK